MTVFDLKLQHAMNNNCDDNKSIVALATIYANMRNDDKENPHFIKDFSIVLNSLIKGV